MINISCGFIPGKWRQFKAVYDTIAYLTQLAICQQSVQLWLSKQNNIDQFMPVSFKIRPLTNARMSHSMGQIPRQCVFPNHLSLKVLRSEQRSENSAGPAWVEYSPS